jgi:hypothetical protein
VIPNGVLFGPAYLGQSIARLLRPCREGESARPCFCRACTQKKGFSTLLNAWALVAPQGWRLQIAGPDEGGHLADVMALGAQARY